MESKVGVKTRLNHVDSDMWGYIVCFGTVITFIAGIGHVNSFGLIYNDFINETHATAKSLTTAHGLFAIMLAIGGIILNILSKTYSLRFGGLMGSLIFVTGSVATIFVTNTSQLPITFGVLQGIGFGMMVPVSYATLNFYFVRKRTTVMSVCKAFQGTALMFYPQFIKKTMSYYGFRGTLLILSGISLHTVAGMITMLTNPKKPVMIQKANKRNGRKSNDCENWHCGEDSHLNTRQGTAPEKRTRESRFQILEILNVKVLKDPVYCNICIGLSFVNFSDLIFFIFLPMLLFQYGYDKAQVAMCISICAGADVVGRCALAALSCVTTINTRWLYYITTLFTLVIRIAILQVRQFWWMTPIAGILGVLRAWLHVASPLAISNHVASEDFPGAYAIFMLAAGLVNVTFAPLIGLLKDTYQDYEPAFYALALCCVPCLVFWPLEFMLKSN